MGVCAYLAIVACSPASGGNDQENTGGSFGAAGFTGASGASGAPSASGGAGGIINGAGGFVATGGVPDQGGAGGTPFSGFFITLPGVDPQTPLDQLTGEQLVQACGDFGQYFRREVPDADVVRGNCVQDAVFAKGATTVPQCQQISSECIAAAAPAPPVLQCVPPATGFTCPATVATFVQCSTDITAGEKRLYALLICESIDDPAIQQKLDAALVYPPSCAAFSQSCPSFFPPPPMPMPMPAP